MCFLNCCLTPSGWSHLWLSLFFSAVALSLTSSIQQIHCDNIKRQKTECQLVSILYQSPPSCIALTFCNVFITAPRSDLANHHIWDLTILPRIPLCGRSRSSGVIPIPYHTMPGHTLPYHTRSYLTMPYQVIPYHAIPGHTLPYHTIPGHTSPNYGSPPLSQRSIAPATYLQGRPSLGNDTGEHYPRNHGCHHCKKKLSEYDSESRCFCIFAS